MTPGEAVLEHHRSFAEQVTSHGLVLEEGGIDGRVLAHSMDSSIKPDIEDAWLPRDQLDARLAQAKAAGVHTVRLVLGEGIINVVPVGEPRGTRKRTHLPMPAGFPLLTARRQVSDRIGVRDRP